VLDLDETLVHTRFHHDPRFHPDLLFHISRGESRDTAYVKVRPHCMHFIKEMSQYYEIILFTASHREVILL
jgi:TFIIF-interacting CTD phosphatase-like protein